MDNLRYFQAAVGLGPVRRAARGMIGVSRNRCFGLLAAAAAAFVLTACPDNDFSASAYVYNASNQQMFFEISRVPGLTCETLEAIGAEQLERNDFESLGQFTLSPHEVLPLDSRLGSESCNCPVFRVSSEGRSTVVRTPTDSVSMPKAPYKKEVLRARSRLIFVEPGSDPSPGSGLEVLDVPLSAPTANCGDEPQLMTFSMRIPYFENATVVSVEPVAGQCFEVTTVTEGTSTGSSSNGSGGSGSGSTGASSTGTPGAGGAPSDGSGMAGMAGGVGSAGEGGRLDPESTGGAGGEFGSGGASGQGGEAGAAPEEMGPREERVYICAPVELFPFVPGDIIDVTSNRHEAFERPLFVLDITAVGDVGREFKMLLGSGHQNATPISYEVQEALLRPCGPRRDEQRALWQPVAVKARGGLGARSLRQGEIVDSETVNAQSVSIYLGRARRYINDDMCQGLEENTWLEIVESRVR